MLFQLLSGQENERRSENMKTLFKSGVFSIMFLTGIAILAFKVKSMISSGKLEDNYFAFLWLIFVILLGTILASVPLAVLVESFKKKGWLKND